MHNHQYDDLKQPHPLAAKQSTLTNIMLANTLKQYSGFIFAQLLPNSMYYVWKIPWIFSWNNNFPWCVLNWCNSMTFNDNFKFHFFPWMYEATYYCAIKNVLTKVSDNTNSKCYHHFATYLPANAWYHTHCFDETKKCSNHCR